MKIVCEPLWIAKQFQRCCESDLKRYICRVAGWVIDYFEELKILYIKCMKKISVWLSLLITLLMPCVVNSQSGGIVNAERKAILPSGKKYDKTYTDYLVAQDHIDLCWWFDWKRAVVDIFNTTGKQIPLLKNNIDFKFMFPQSQVYRWMQEYNTDIFNEVKSYIKSGRWEVSGGQWCEPDNTVPSGETAARNFLIGKRYARKELGVDPKIGYLPDSFGHIWTYPQILKLSGIDFFVETKMDCNSTIRVPLLCNWTSPDGTSLLTCNTFLYAGHVFGQRLRGFETYNQTLDYMNGTMDAAVAVGLKKSLRTFSQVRDNSGGPDQKELDSVRIFNSRLAGPNAIFSTFQNYYQDIKSDPALKGLPAINDELYVDSRRGVWSCGAAEKYYRRKTDVKAEETEKFASMAMWLGSAAYPVDKMRQSWEFICLLTNHDHSNGTWCNNIAYNRTLRTFGITTNLLGKTIDNVLDAIASEASTEVGKTNVPVIVFNSLSWTRNDVVETRVVFENSVKAVRVYDDTGRETPSQITSSDGKNLTIIFEANDIPGTGFKVFRITPAETVRSYETGLYTGNNIIENNSIKATLNTTTGNFSSIMLKSDSWEAVKPGNEANELQLLIDKSIARDLDQKEMEATPLLINNMTDLKVIEQGPVRIVYRFNKSTPAGVTKGSAITQDIIMYSNIDRIDIKTDVDWDEQFRFLKVSFPLNVTPDSCTYEIPFGNISRSTTRNTPETSAKFEVYGHKWADMSQGGYGVSILNDSKYGWDALGNRLRLSLLRSPNNKDTRFEKGSYTSVYSIYPHRGDWKQARTVREANELNYPLIAKQVSRHGGRLGKNFSFVSVDHPNVMISAIKKAEDSPNDLIVRIVEINGVPSTNCRITFQGPINRADVVNLIEDSLGKARYSGRTLTTELHKYEIQSFRVSVANQDYKDSRPQLTKVDLSGSFNLDGISSNKSWNDGNIDNNGNSLSAELMPEKFVSEDVEFMTGRADNGSDNMVQCKGQTIKLPPGRYSSMKILAIAAGGGADEQGTFKIRYAGGKDLSETLSVRDWIAEFYSLDGDLNGWNKPIDENIAYIFTHRHTSAGDDTCRTTYLFKYEIGMDEAGSAETLVLPVNDKIKILGITLIRTSDRQVRKMTGSTTVPLTGNSGQTAGHLRTEAWYPGINDPIVERDFKTISELNTRQTTGGSGPDNDRVKNSDLLKTGSYYINL